MSLGHGNFITLEFGKPCLSVDSETNIHGDVTGEVTTEYGYNAIERVTYRQKTLVVLKQ